MSLNTRRLDRSKKASKKGSGGSFFQFEDGKNIIRVFTFNHTVRESDFSRGFYFKDDGVKVGDNFDEIDREVWRHFTEDGVVNCIGKNCSHCADSDDLIKSKHKRDKKAGQDLRASRAFYINLVNVQDAGAGMQIGSIPQSVYGEILTYIQDPEFGESILGAEGRDFIVERDTSLTPDKMYRVKLRDEKNCEDMDGELETTNLFDCIALEPGWSSNEDLNESDPDVIPDSDDEEKPKKSTTSKSKPSNKKPSGKRKEENDFEDEEKPKGKSGSGSKPPWEKGGKESKDEEPPDEFKLKDIVSFSDPDEGDMDGYILEIDETNQVAAIQTGTEDTDIFDIPFEEITLVERPKPKSGGRRRS